MFPKKLRRKCHQINGACRRFGARRIRVFGSVVCGKERAASEIDLLAGLSRAYHMFTLRPPRGKGL